MRRLPIAILASLLALVLIAPAARGATQVRHVRVEMGAMPQTMPPTPPGTLTLDFVFKNKRGSKNKFTPRQLTRIDFSRVPLFCLNTPSQYTSQLEFTTTLGTAVKLKKLPPPHGSKPKPGRYAFNFAYGFTGFTGTLSGTIDKPNGPEKPRAPRSQGTLVIDDLDSDPGHMNCSTTGRRSWGGLPLTGA